MRHSHRIGGAVARRGARLSRSGAGASRHRDIATAPERIEFVHTGNQPDQREKKMTGVRKNLLGSGAAIAALLASLAAAQAGNLKIESWRNDDADIWNSKIIPAFNKHYPDIKVEFSPSAPKEYNAALNA